MKYISSLYIYIIHLYLLFRYNNLIEVKILIRYIFIIEAF